MKAILRISLTLIALSLPTFSASAIEADAAIALCKKNPKCKQTDRENGEVVFQVGESLIECPLIGQCVCTVCPGPKKVKVLGGKTKEIIMSIPLMLQQGAAQ